MPEVAIYSPNQHAQVSLREGSLLLGPESTSRECSIPISDGDGRFPHASLELVRRDAVSVVNRGESVVLPGGKRILAGMSKTLELPAEFWIGNVCVYVHADDAELPHDRSLTTFPRLEDDPFQFAGVMKKLGGAPSSHTLAFWFEALGRLQRSVAGTREFFADAARALFDPGGLDLGMVLLRENDDWKIAASFVSHADPNVVFRRRLLDRVLTEKRTIFHDAKGIAEGNHEQCGGFVVVAPIQSESGEVLGALYGARFDHENNNRRGIRPLEAQFAQAAADTVAAGLIRLRRETEAVRMRARVEQVFSPHVARELERDPKLLEGRQRETTILFCDLRGFTSLCERLSPRESYMLLGDVMDRFTHCITQQDGVIIDYFGDGLAAFWNAPLDQPDHARLACQAAFDMTEELPELSADWFGVTGRNLRLGIGIHSGPALVGNAGSRSRIKYGPRGGTVNMASRVENATKQIGLPILLTHGTMERLAGAIPVRRVFRFSPAGFDHTVDLYQPLTSAIAEEIAEHQGLFRESLERYDSRQFEASGKIIASLQAAGVIDPAVDHLARRIREVNEERKHAVIAQSPNRCDANSTPSR